MNKTYPDPYVIRALPGILRIGSILLMFLALIVAEVSAQESKDKKQIREAEKLFMANKFDKALPIYKELAAKYPDDPQYSYSIGLCYLNSRTEKGQSIEYLRETVQSPDTIPEAYYFLGQAYHVNHKFNEAIRYYELFKIFLKDNEEGRVLRNEVNRRIKQCGHGKQFISNPLRIEIRNLGKNINTQWGDYVPVISADESILIFTSRREGITGGFIDDNGEYYEDVYYSVNINDEWQPSQRIDSTSVIYSEKDKTNINKARVESDTMVINSIYHDAAIGLSADGQKLFIYKSKVAPHDIFICLLQGSNWSTPQKLPAPINTKYWEGHASLSGDENDLYFSSDRPGGFGGKDIYKAKRLPGGKWGLPVNLGPIVNTKYDEDSPFIHPDGETLYFSSHGHNSMGGYDIFMSSLKGGGWSEPKNMAYPINTADDDLYFVLSGDGQRAYFSSYREDGFGHQDIYVIDLPEDYYKKPVYTLMRGFVTECGEPSGADILVFDNETGELQGLYRANKATGKYLIAIPAGRNYNITIKSKGQIFQSENIYFPRQDTFIKIEKNIDLLCGELGDQICLKNIFFEGYSSKIEAESKPELDNIYQFLKENPLISLRIVSYVDKRYVEADVAYARSISVVESLVDRGIKGDRLMPEGYAVYDDPSTLDKKDKVCLEIIGGHLGEKNPKSPKTQVELDDLYFNVLQDCGDYVFEDILFKIQIGAFKNARSAKFEDLRNKEWILYLKMEKEIAETGITRFTVGPFQTLNEAEDLRQKIIEEGIVGAWTVPYHKGRRVPLDQIRVMCENDTVKKRPKPIVLPQDTIPIPKDIVIELKCLVIEELKGEEFPVEGVQVDLYNKTTNSYEDEYMTLDDGRFYFTLQAYQEYAVIGNKDGYSPGRYDFSTKGYTQSDTINCNLFMEPFYELLNLEGVVVNRENQEPIPYAQVKLVNKSKSLLENQLATLENGTFIVNVSSNTVYELSGTKAGFTQDKKSISTIGKTAADKLFVKLEIEQAPCLKLDGYVVERDTEEPLDQVFIEIYNLATKEIMQAVTSPDGVFEGCLPPEADFIIRGSKSGYFTNCVEVSTIGVPADEAIFAKLELAKIQVGVGIKIENIYYDFNKFNIRPDAAFELNKIVRLLNTNPEIKIELGSHTDSRGSDSYNEWLSQKRAEAAVNYIISKGISNQRITARGYGEYELTNRCSNGVNCSEEEHQANRRTEFKVIGFVQDIENPLDETTAQPGVQSNPETSRPGEIDCPNLEIE